MIDESSVLNIQFQMPRFDPYVMPTGFLSPDTPCHALFYYYLAARRTYENDVVDPIVYEGEPDPEVNFRQLFTSIATAYGVQPEHMLKYWSNVDLQCNLLRLPLMPSGDQYRFDKVAEMRTQ